MIEGRWRVTSTDGASCVVEHAMSVASSPRQVGTTEERTFKLTAEGINLGRVYPDGDRFEAIWLRKASLP